MLLNCSVAAGGNRALKSLVTSKNAPSTTSWAATSLTRRNMLRSCVLVSRRILCGATTCSGSDASHSGVEVGGGSTTDGMPPPQAINRVAQNTIAVRAPSHLPGRIAYLLRLIAEVTPAANGGSAICNLRKTSTRRPASRSCRPARDRYTCVQGATEAVTVVIPPLYTPRLRGRIDV